MTLWAWLSASDTHVAWACFAVAVAIAAFWLARLAIRDYQRKLAAEDARFDALRDPGLGVLEVDREIWAPTNRETWEPSRYHQSPTPIYDQLAAEAVIASADAVVAEAWQREGEGQ